MEDEINCYRVIAIGGDRSGRGIAFLDTMYDGSEDYSCEVWSMKKTGNILSIAKLCSLTDGYPIPEQVTVSKGGWVAAYDKVISPNGVEIDALGISEGETVHCQDLPNGRVSITNWLVPSGICLLDAAGEFTASATLAGHEIVASTAWGAFLDFGNRLWTRDRSDEGRTDSWLSLEEWAGKKIADLVAGGWELHLESSNPECGMLVQLTKESLPPKVFVLLPLEVKLVAFGTFDNVSDHTDPWEPHAKKGLRIFPGFKTPAPADATLREKLTVVVKSAPALAGMKVYLKAFDIDDGTSEAFDQDPVTGAPVIDIYGPAGDDNLPDYLGIPASGQFWNTAGGSWGIGSAGIDLGSDGTAEIDYRVGMQPGNNYRIVASLIDQAMYVGVQTADPAAPGYLGPLPAQDGAASASPPLTVWRKLWVENDSMEKIPVDEFWYKRNDLSSDIEVPTIYNASAYPVGGTGFVISAISDTTSFENLENGRIIVQSEILPVTSAFIAGTGAHVVNVAGDHTSVPVNSGFRLYDDDDFGLDTDPLPRSGTTSLVDDQLKHYFKPGFIEIVDARDFNPRRILPFHRNEDVSSNGYGVSSTIVDDFKDLTDREACWVCPVTAAYQGPHDVDNDPDAGENTRFGETATYAGNDHSTVFVEACRENYEYLLRSHAPGSKELGLVSLRKWICATTAHEMGHQPAHQSELVDHSEGKLMSNAMEEVGSLIPESAIFSPKTVLRFRKANRWSE